MTIAINSTRAAQLVAAGWADNPFIAWDNAGALATLGGTATLVDGSAANAFSGTTFDFWRPDVTATTARLSAQFAAARTVALAAIAAHNLGTLGATIAVQRSTDGISWTDAGAGAITPVDDSPIVWRMVTTGADAAYWRFYITGLTAGDPVQIGVAFLGDDLVVPDRFYQGFSPVIVPTEVQAQSNISVGGHLMGSSIIAQGSTLSAQFSHVPATFVRGDLKPFMQHFNRVKGFFFGWRPSTYPQDVHFCWRNGDVIRPVNTGPRDIMSFSMGVSVLEVSDV